jgi:hypothetical protein
VLRAPDENTVAVFELEVTDNDGATSTDTVEVTVTRFDAQTAYVGLPDHVALALPPTATLAASGARLIGVREGELELYELRDGQMELLGRAPACDSPKYTALDLQRALVACEVEVRQVKELVLFDTSGDQPLEIARRTLDRNIRAVAANDGIAAIWLNGGLSKILSTFEEDALDELSELSLYGEVYLSHGVLVNTQFSFTEFWDVTDPAAPTRRNTLDIGAESAALRGDRLVLSENPRLLHVVRLEPQVGGTLEASQDVIRATSNMRDVATDGDHAYLGGSRTLDVYDLTDNVRRRRGFSLPPLDAGRTHVVAGWAVRQDVMVELRELDAGTPLLAPVDESVRAIVLLEGTVALLASREEVGVYDLADPAVPVRLSSVALPYRLQSVAQAGSIIYVAMYEDGGHHHLGILDLTEHDDARLVEARDLGNVPVPGGFKVEVQGDQLMYRHGFTNDLVKIFDLSDPTQPVLIREHDLGSDILWAGDLLLSRYVFTYILSRWVDGELETIDRIDRTDDLGHAIGFSGDTIIMRMDDGAVVCADIETRQIRSVLPAGLAPRVGRRADGWRLHHYRGIVDFEIPSPGICRVTRALTDSLGEIATVDRDENIYSSVWAPGASYLSASRPAAGTAAGDHRHVLPGQTVRWEVTVQGGHRALCHATGGQCHAQGDGPDWEVSWTAPDESGEHEVAISAGDARMLEVLKRDRMYVGP